MKYSVLVTRKWPSIVEERLRIEYGATLNVDDRAMTAEELRAGLVSFQVVCPTVSDRLTAEVLQSARAVRLLCNYGAGVDHIDLDACRQRGVIVTNTPDVLSEATAELAVLLMLMVLRRAGEGERELRAGRWTGWRPTHLVGRQLSGRVLGLVGFGRIARATARRAAALGMQVAYHGRRRAEPAVERESDALFVPDLRALLARSDVVSLHVPGGLATRHLIGWPELEAIGPDGVLVNTARGSVVDEAALAAALRGGIIAGAGLDVFEGEPAVDPALLMAPNLVALPHLGSATRETRVAMGERALLNLATWAAGGDPPDRVA